MHHLYTKSFPARRPGKTPELLSNNQQGIPIYALLHTHVLIRLFKRLQQLLAAINGNNIVTVQQHLA